MRALVRAACVPREAGTHKMAPRSARVGGGVTNRDGGNAHLGSGRGFVPKQNLGAPQNADERTKSVHNAEVSQTSARALFSSRQGVGEVLGGEQHQLTDLTKKHKYVAGEAHVHGLYDKEVEVTKVQSRAIDIAALYADKTIVTPQWLKVSESPFMAAAKASGGYGRRMDDTTVSLDAPDFFHIPEVMTHDPKISMQGGITGKAKVQEGQIRDDTTISLDVPDWMKIREVVEFADADKTLDNAPHMHLLIGKQVLCEPFLPEDDEEPIDWDKVDAALAAAQADDAANVFPEKPADGASARLPPVKPSNSARQTSARAGGAPPGRSARDDGGGATTARLAQGEMSRPQPTLPPASSRDRLFTPSARG